jgi:hypothetical protein
MNKKVVGGLFALIAIVSIVNTQAILKLSKESKLINNATNQMAAVMTSRSSTVVKSPVVKEQTVEDYLKIKYPRDYQKITESLKVKTQSYLERTLDSKDPEELRRFLCWITGGIWVQVGPSRSCLYPENRSMLDEVGDGNIVLNLVKTYVKSAGDIEKGYFKANHGFADSVTVYQGLESVFTGTGVNVEALGPGFRRFLCRLFGGTWTPSSEVEMDGVTASFSSCTY